MYGLVEAGYRCGGMVGLADGMAAGSWYSVLRDLSSSFCSTLCAFEADLMSMNDTVAQTPLPPNTTSSFDLASILTLCTRPYLLKCSRIFSSRILSGRFPTQRWRVSLTIMSPTLHHSGTRPNTQVAQDSTAVQRIPERENHTLAHTHKHARNGDGSGNEK